MSTVIICDKCKEPIGDSERVELNIQNHKNNKKQTIDLHANCLSGLFPNIWVAQD